MVPSAFTRTVVSNKGVTVATAIDGVSNRIIQQHGGVAIFSNGTTWSAATGYPANLGSSGIVDQDQLPTASPADGSNIKGAIIPGTTFTMSGTGNKTMNVSNNILTTAITFIIDGGGSAITTGVKGDLEIPFACTITAVRVFLDQSGSIVVDIWKDTYANYPPTGADSITASAKPTVSSATKSQDTTLTGWTTTITAGNTLRFNVDSITTATRATVVLTCVKS